MKQMREGCGTRHIKDKFKNKFKGKFKRRSTGKIAYATELAGFAAVGAEAAYFCAGYCDFYAAVAGDLGLQLFV
jgi:hypothetical protein